ncbi:MAG: hypothetical protein AB1798_24485 [Spirochaetota bacterium]
MRKNCKTLLVSYAWNANKVYPNCFLCNNTITPGKGDYIFRLKDTKDKKQENFICKNCVLKLQSSEKKLKIVSSGYFLDMINLKTAYWRMK